MNQKVRKAIEKIKEWGIFLFKSLVSGKNLKRDIFIIVPYLIVLAVFIFNLKADLFKNNRSEKVDGIMDATLSEEQIYEEVKLVQETLDLTNWKTYQSRWYGVEVKYPESWLPLKIQAVPRGAAWEYRYQFRKKIADENDPYVGFDLVIYNLVKIKELTDTAEFPIVKNEKLKGEGKCDTFAGHLIETGDYPAEEIYFPPADDCYNPTLFFSFTKDQYIYNIVPITKAGLELKGDPRVEIIDNFPEFFGVASTLKIIDIVRPRPAVRPRINAPKPLAETSRDSAGRMVCANKNDNPSKSNKGKGKHMDMECCLDPDEYPNPWCYYPPEKYGKYLK